MEQLHLKDICSQELISSIYKLASHSSFYDKIIYFIKNGITNINYRNYLGNTPIHALLSLENFNIFTFELCKLLIKKGANINIPNNKQIFPLATILETDITDQYHMNIYHKKDKDCYRLLDFIMNNTYASLNLQNNMGDSVFHQILMNPYSDLNLEKIKYILKYNPDMHIENCYGMNAFHHLYLVIDNNILEVKDYENHENIVELCIYLKTKFGNFTIFPLSKFIYISEDIKSNILIQKISEILNQ